MGIAQTYETGRSTEVCTNGPVYSTYFGDVNEISGRESKFKNIYEFEPSVIEPSVLEDMREIYKKMNESKE